MPAVTVRAAGPEDVSAVAGLRWSWIVEEEGGRPIRPRDRFEAEFADWVRQHTASHTCFVAEVDRSLVGMAWLALADRVPSPRASDRRAADLQSVYVLPAFRRGGVGARLVDAAVDAAREAGAERVVVHSSAAAVGTYARAGMRSSDRLLQRTLRSIGEPGAS